MLAEDEPFLPLVTRSKNLQISPESAEGQSVKKARGCRRPGAAEGQTVRSTTQCAALSAVPLRDHVFLFSSRHHVVRSLLVILQFPLVCFLGSKVLGCQTT